MLAWLIPGGGVLSAVGNVFSLVVKFATSTIGMIVIALFAGYLGGHHVAAKKCNAERLASQLAAVKADLKAANTAAAIAQTQAASLDEESRANEEKVNALEADLRNRSDRKCGLSRGDALRLRGIK